VSKTFVATAVMQLVEQGKINLDEKADHLSSLVQAWDPNFKNITIRQMLNHTSGIGDVDDYEWDKPQYDDASAEKYVRGWHQARCASLPAPIGLTGNDDLTHGCRDLNRFGPCLSRRMSGKIFSIRWRCPTRALSTRNPGFTEGDGTQLGRQTFVSKIYLITESMPQSTLNSNVLEMTHYAIANLHHGEYKGKRILSDDSYHMLWTNSVICPTPTKRKLA